MLAPDANSLSAQALTPCYDYGRQYPWIVNDGRGLNVVVPETVAAERVESFEWRPTPWKECRADATKSVIDGAFAVSYTAKAPMFDLALQLH